MPMPHDVPAPDTLLGAARDLLGKFGDAVPEGIRRYWERDRPIEMRPVMLEHYTSREKLEPRAEHLDPHHRPGSGRPRASRRPCSPISPT